MRAPFAPRGLPDIPFHASPLMNGKGQYSGLDLRTRKMLLGSFRVFFRHTPVRCHAFACTTKQPASLEKLAGTMRRDLVNFPFDNLAELRAYDAVKCAEHTATALWSPVLSARPDSP